MASVLLLGCTSQSNSAPATAKELVKATFILEKADGSTETKTIEVEKGSNAFDAMKKVFSVQAKKSSFGEFIESIEGIKPDAEHFWALYVDGKFATKAIDAYTLDKDTEIKWSYKNVSEYEQ
ncbi:MAG: DUF4430 domain-containing protein [Candidatus Diapherotrites archaeon]